MKAKLFILLLLPFLGRGLGEGSLFAQGSNVQQSMTVCGTTEKYTVPSAAEATHFTTYRWLENGALVSGTAATYTKPATPAKPAGEYSYVRQAKIEGCDEWMSTAPYVVKVIDPTPTRTGGSPTQTVKVGTPIVTIEYTSSVGLQATPSGTLPTGLQATLSDGGKRYTIAGTPNAGGTYAYTLKANDAPDCPGNAISGTITVNGPFFISGSARTNPPWYGYISWQGCPDTSPNFSSSTSHTPTCYHDAAKKITYYNHAFLENAANLADLTYACSLITIGSGGYVLPGESASTSNTGSTMVASGYYNGSNFVPPTGAVPGHTWSTYCQSESPTTYRVYSFSSTNAVTITNLNRYYGVPLLCYKP
jgi:hypothetical protein